MGITIGKDKPKIALAFVGGLALGFLACHLHLCERLGLCAPVAVEQPPLSIDPGPR